VIELINPPLPNTSTTLVDQPSLKLMPVRRSDDPTQDHLEPAGETYAIRRRDAYVDRYTIIDMQLPPGGFFPPDAA
jgi:hypothetical protein